MKPKIYISYVPLFSGLGVVQDSTPGGDVQGYAMTEDGIVLASHTCSNEDFVKMDMGLTSNRKHEIYDRAFPDGYELVWRGQESDKHLENAT